MAKKSPLQIVNEVHGNKEKLVDKVMGLIDLKDEPKEELKTRLRSAANSKLLRLFTVSSAVKKQFGGAEQLVDATLKLMGRSKDKDYREALLTWSPVKLYSVYRRWERQTGTPVAR